MEGKQQFVFLEETSAGVFVNLLFVTFGDGLEFFLQGVGQTGVFLHMFSDVGGEKVDIGVQTHLVHVVKLREIVNNEEEFGSDFGEILIVLSCGKGLFHGSN